MNITSVTLRKEGSLTRKKSAKSIGLCFIVLKKVENGSRLKDKVSVYPYPKSSCMHAVA